MNTSLITSDGFPRNDLDIAQSTPFLLHIYSALANVMVVRTTRARIIRLQNDYKNLMSRIEAGLHDHFARSKDQTTSPTNLQPVSSLNVPIQGGSNAVGEEEGYGVAAFAKVNSVVSGSPADQAGLEAGDEILLFGDINWLNHEKLAGVARTVQRNEGLRVRVKVSRQDTNGVREEHNLELIPRSNWGGRGLLGCHLLPL